MKRKHIFKLLTLALSASLLLTPLSSYAFMADIDVQKLLPIQSNQIDNWPAGPQVTSYSAILIDADSGVVLYEKNAKEKMYPASTTKLLTCLLAMEKENSNLNDMVNFSWDAVMTVPSDSSNMGMDAGESMTLEECLYGVLVLSANEVANAIAEYVSGDIGSFVDLMNDRAKELGCTNTHFANAHGYTNPDHYTTAYDLSLIAKEFFKDQLLSKISRTPRYHWYATDTQPDDILLGSTNYFMRGTQYCEGIVGSKTGYTDESRNCLVTCAERNGMKLIAVVMKTETPYQYEDTNILLDYGFSNFEKVKVSDYETKYTVTDKSFFHSDASVFGDSSPILTMDNDSYILLPKTISFSDLSSSIELNTDSTKEDLIATVSYSYGSVNLGTANIYFEKKSNTSFQFDETDPDVNAEDLSTSKKEPTFIYINYIIYGIIGVFILIIIFTIIKKIFNSLHFKERFSARRHHRRKSYRLTYSNKPKKRKRARPGRFSRSHYLDL